MDIFPSSPVVISPRFRSFNPTNSFQPSTRLKQRLPRSMSTSSIPRAPKDHVGETKQQSELSKPAWDDVKSSARIDDKDKSSIKIEPRIIMSDGGYVLEDVPCLSDYIPNLPTYPNPLQDNPAYSIVKQNFLDEDDTIAQKVVVQRESPRGTHFRRAGCRQKVYFKPEEVHACIVTCGGLCPGMNTVIREIVCGLYHMYGVTRVLGIEGGLGGFYANDTKSLTPEVVNNIHKRGGTILGTSSGRHNATKIVDSIKERGVNQVYIIGGDGTQKAAAEIYEEIKKRCLKVSVIGIPKTIDNDIPVIDKSFGFDTAVEESERAINATHVEAESVENGIGLVKLMGRNSGFIAMYATLASRDVDCCLIPESPFYLEGPGGLFDFIEKRLKENGHMVIVMAEGAGKDIFSERIGAMEHEDLGLLLSQKIRSYFARPGKMAINLKYIDPTYMIRAVPSNASDNVCCTLLAQNAVHGAMAGYTGFTVGPVNGQHAYIPFSRMTEKQNKVVITDRIWARLLSSTHQPSFLDHKDFKEIVRVYESKEEKKPQINLPNLKTEGKKPQIKLTNSKSYSVSRTQLVNEEDYSVSAILKQFRKY